jgi:N-acetylglucosaminyldiphosphoundecaprenol N-acetyl-beta-D-mannosaminyltransferase
MNILGVRIDDYSVDGIKEEIVRALIHPSGRKFVTTLNPEIILKAHRDGEYRKILNRADLNICDGFGLMVASFFKGKRIKSRFAGADLADFLLESASQKKYQTIVVAAKKSLSTPEEIEKIISRKYEEIPIKSLYFDIGQNFFENGIIQTAEIVFVNFGAPDQEKFIFENREKFPKAKILVGIGGTFDFLTGKIRRAPGAWRALGLEWLWRLIQEPKRFRRIIDAVIVFPALAFWE